MTAVFGILILALIHAVYGYPEPFIHDEFAYLLGADTFLEGRLTNPTPPMHEFFETFHVNMTPTYHSKYPPGQSAFLALGKLIFGREIFGVWLSFLLSAIAVTWALLCIMPSKWALFGGVLSIANYTLLARWAFSYWGGSVAMLGGALFMGGLFRLYQHPRVSGALWISLGLLIMSFSRPLEGLITAAILLLFYLCTRIKKTKSLIGFRDDFKVLAILGLAGILILAINLAYNRILTGSALTFPHKAWRADTSAHEMIRSYQGSEPNTTAVKFYRLFSVYVGLFLWAPALLVFRQIRDPKVHSVLCMVFFLSTYTVLTSRAWPHYIAPAMPFIISLLVSGCMTLSRWKIGSTRIGFILFSFVVMFHFGRELTLFLDHSDRINFNASRERGAVFKRDVDRQLEAIPGNHLIFVRHLEGHSIHWEYVYNRADIPSARVIWAREMSVEANRQLVAAYPDRQLWLLQLWNFSVKLTQVNH